MNERSIRLVAFNSAKWLPNRSEWMLANKLIKPDEVDRISKFAFKKDAKASMIGRLLLRRLLTDGLPSTAQWSLVRNSEDRPVLAQKVEGFDFNVSHQGDFSVAVAGHCDHIGVDVMRMKYSGGKPIADFFRLMRKQFTQLEWSYIETPTEAEHRLSRFYRLWTLKESYVKAIGVGLGMDLQRISFRICTELPLNPIMVTSTTVQLDGIARTDWNFTETLLDDQHCIATAVHASNTTTTTTTTKIDCCEQIHSFSELVHELRPQNDFDDHQLGTLWLQFSNKHDTL